MESDKETDVKKTWRHVPHWTFESGIDFVTWRLHKNQFELASEEKDFIMDVLQNSNEKRYQLFSFVVMNDHVHVLFGPLKDQSFSKIMRTWRSFSANRLQRLFGKQGSVWQEDYFDRIIRDEKQFYAVIRYILDNPWKGWGIKDYKWCRYNPIDDAGTAARTPG